MPNAVVKLYRQLHPDDPRSDDDLTLEYGNQYGVDQFRDFPDFQTDYQRLSSPNRGDSLTDEERARIAGIFPSGAPDYVAQAAGSAARGAGGMISSVLRGVGTIARQAGRSSASREGEEEIVPSPQPGAIENVPLAVAEAVAPAPVPGLEGSFLATKVPEALGAGAAFLGGAALTGGLGLAAGLPATAAELAGAGGIGALAGFQSGWEDAKAHKASDDLAWHSALLNAGVGAATAFPIGKLLGRLDKLSGQTLRQSLIHGAQDTVLGATFGALQGVSGDVIAGKILQYDKDRVAFDNLGKDLAVGGVSMGLLSAVTQIIGGKIANLRSKAQQKATTEPPPPAPPAGPAFPDVAEQYRPPVSTVQVEPLVRPTPISEAELSGQDTAAPDYRPPPTPTEEYSQEGFIPEPTDLPRQVGEEAPPTTEVSDAPISRQLIESAEPERLGATTQVQGDRENRNVPPEVQGESGETGSGNRLPEGGRVTPTPPTAIAIRGPVVRAPVPETSSRGFDPSANPEPHPLIARTDWDGQPTQAVSGRGRNRRSESGPVPDNLVAITGGDHEGQSAVLVGEPIGPKGEKYAKVKIEETGEELTLLRSQVKKLSSIRDEVSGEMGGKKSAVVEPAYFEVQTPIRTEEDAARLYSRSSPTTAEVAAAGGASANTLTHRLAAFLKEGVVAILPVYKYKPKGSNVWKMMVGTPSGKGTPLMDLIKRGYKAIGSFRVIDAVHAGESAKIVLPYDEYLTRIEQPSKQKLAADNSYEEAVLGATGIETGAGGEPVRVATVLPVQGAEVHLSNRVAGRVFEEIVAKSAGKPEGHPVEDLVLSALESVAKTDPGARRELAENMAHLSDQLGGNGKAANYVIDRLAKAFGNSRTSQDFTGSISQPEGGAVAAGGSAGLSGGAVGGAATGEAGRTSVLPVAPDSGVARSRVGSGGGEPGGDSVRARHREVIEANGIQGVDVAVLQQNLDALNDFYQRSGGGVNYEKGIALVVSDITDATHQDLIAAIHESAHETFKRLPQAVQDRLTLAIDKLSDSTLGLEASTDARLTGDTLGPTVLSEERLVESVAIKLADQGFSPVESRSFSQTIVRALKDLYTRVAMAVQSALFGADHVNPETALSYFQNRVESFLAGDPQPLSFLSFIGGGRPNSYRQATFYTPVDGLYVPMTLEADGSFRYQNYIPDTVGAALRNIDLAVSEASDQARFTRPTTVAEVRPIGGEEATAAAEPDFAAQKHLDGILRKAYDGYLSTLGDTPPASTRSFDQFWGEVAAGDKPIDMPPKVMQAIQDHLTFLKQPNVANDLGIEGPRTFNGEATANIARAKSLGGLQKFMSNLTDMNVEALRQIDSGERKLGRVIDRQEKWFSRFNDLDHAFNEAKESISESIREFKAGLKQQFSGGRKLGAIEQQIRQISGDLEGGAPRAWERAIDKVAARAFENKVRFSDFLERAAGLNIDWEQLNGREIRERVAIGLSDDPFLKGLSSDEVDAAVAIVSSFAKQNSNAMAWLEVRQSKDIEAATAIKEMMDTARHETKADLSETQKLINRLPRMRVQAQRILDKYRAARREAESIRAEMIASREFTRAHETMSPILQQEANRLENAIGATYPVTVQHGQDFLLPTGPTASDAEVRESRQTFSQYSTPQQINKWRLQINEWLEANKDRQGAVWHTLDNTSRQLSLWNANKGQVGIHQGVVARVFGSVADIMQNTGTRAGFEAAKKIRDYVVRQQAHQQALEVAGTKVAVAWGDAQKALKIRNPDVFDRVFHNEAFKYFESRRDLADRPDAQEAVLQAWRNELRRNPDWGDRITPEVWAKLKRYYETAALQSDRLVKIQQSLGLKILDPFLGMMRDTLGSPLFTMGRGLRESAEAMWQSMRGEWDGTKFNRIKSEDVSQLYAGGRDAVVKSMESRFTPQTWTEFVGPMANRPSLSVFSGALLPDGVTWRRASVENTKRAHRETADPVSFAERLHQLEGGNEQTLPRFVGETLETFQNWYDSVESVMKETENVRNLWGQHVGSPRFLMDARISEEYPSEWLRYNRLDQNASRSALQRMAFHSAFGRNGSDLAADIRTADRELLDAKAEWQSLRDAMEIKHPEARGSKLVSLTREEAVKRGRPAKFLENADANLRSLHASEDQVKSWMKTTSSDLVEAKVFMEVLSAVASILVQGPKTGIVNTLDMLATPLLQVGVSRAALAQIRRNISSFSSSAAGSMLQVLGGTLHTNSENQQRRIELGQRDPDTVLTLKEKLKAELYADLGLEDKPISSAIVRAARTARALTRTGVKQVAAGDTFPTFKPLSAFTMFSKWMNDALIDGVWANAEDLVNRSVKYLKENPDELSNPALELTPDKLGLKKGLLLDDATAFNNIKARMEEWGVRLEAVAKEAARDGNPVLSKDNYQALASMALNELSLESSIAISPRWFGNPVIRYFKPLLSWSLAKTNQLRKSIADPNGQVNRSTLTSAMKAFAAVVPLGLAYSFLMEEYDENLTGKKTNIRGFGQDNDALAFVERFARLGSFGLWGDVANTIGNLGGGGDLRGVSLDNRVVFMNSLLTLMGAVTAMTHQGTADYQSVYRPVLQALGGSGYLQYAQIINNMLGLDNQESRVVSRINVSNWLRTAGRSMGLDVRIPKGGGPDVQPNPITPAVANMVLSAYANDVTSFMENYRDAVSAARESGKPDPAEFVRRSYAAHNPLRTTFVTPPSDLEYRRILTELPDDGRQAVMSSITLFNRYADMIGARPFEGKEQKRPAAPRSGSPSLIGFPPARPAASSLLFR